MDKVSNIKVVDRLKASELLGVKNTDFYNIYYQRLKINSVFGKDGRKRLYLLDDVMAIKKEIDSISVKYEIVR